MIWDLTPSRKSGSGVEILFYVSVRTSSKNVLQLS